jgi:hypothetical protein
VTLRRRAGILVRCTAMTAGKTVRDLIQRAWNGGHADELERF